MTHRRFKTFRMAFRTRRGIRVPNGQRLHIGNLPAGCLVTIQQDGDTFIGVVVATARSVLVSVRAALHHAGYKLGEIRGGDLKVAVDEFPRQDGEGA